MEAQRFLNRYQPQTLVMATMLAYWQAAFDLLGGLQSGALILVVIAAAKGGGAYGIANSKKWGYWLAVAGAVVGSLLTLLISGSFFWLALRLTFDLALVGLLLHPQSRNYQRIWFE